MNNNADNLPIFGLSSGTGGAIAIVRCSGPASIDIARKIFLTPNRKKKSRFVSHVMNYGLLWDDERSAILDEVYLVYFEAGRSYTGEDLVEIHCHGSNAIIQRIGQILTSLGVVPASPGEFTRRAFFNGRIGLSQAEAVQELVEADSLQHASIAINNVSGGLKSKITSLREQLVDCAAHLEATLDYPEEDIDFIDQNSLIQGVRSISSVVTEIFENYDRYQLIRDGIQVAILGAPNAGKSSLLNAFLKKDRAIVTDIAGTTRDHIEESIIIRGFKFSLIDTAGIRTTDNQIEKIGIERALEFEKNSTLKIFLYDGSEPAILRDSDDRTLHVFNKSDLNLHEENQSLVDNSRVIKISALTHNGIPQLEDWMVKQAQQNFSNTNNRELPMLTSIRQRDCMEKASDSLKLFCKSLDRGIPMDIALVELYEAMDFLGQITGKIITEDIVDRIFEKFCIGK